MTEPSSGSGGGSPDPFAAADAYVRSGASGSKPGSTPAASPAPTPPTLSGTPPAASPAPSPLASSGAFAGTGRGGYAPPPRAPPGIPAPLSVDFPAPSPSGVSGPSTTSIVTVTDPSASHPADRAGEVGSSFASSPLSYEEQEFKRRKQKIDGGVRDITDLIGEMGSKRVNLPIGVLERVRNMAGSIQAYNNELAEKYREYGQETIDLSSYTSFLDETMMKVAENCNELSVLRTFLGSITDPANPKLCISLTQKILDYTHIIDKEDLEYSIRLFKWAAEVNSKFSLDRDQSAAREKIIDPRAYPDLETDPSIIRKGLEREARKIYENVRDDESIATRDQKATNSNVMKWLRQAAGELTYFFTEKDFKDLERSARDLDPTIMSHARGHAVSVDAELKMQYYGQEVIHIGSELAEINRGINSGIAGLQDEVTKQTERASIAEEELNKESVEKEETRIQRDDIRRSRSAWTVLGSLAGLAAGIIGMGLVATKYIIPRETKPLEDKVAAVEVERDAAKTQVTSLTSERDVLTSGLTAAEKEVTDLTAAKETLTTDLADEREKVTSLTGERDTYMGERDKARAEVEDLTEKKDELTKIIAEYEALGEPDKIRSAAARVGELTEERDQAKKEAAGLTAEVDGLNKKIERYVKLGEPEEIERLLGGEVVKFTNIIAAERARVAEYEAIGTLAQLRELASGDAAKKLRAYIPLGTPAQIRAMKDSVATLTREGDKAKKEAAGLKKIRDDLAAKVAKYETNLKAEKASVAALTTEKDILTGERDKAQTKVDELKKERDKLAAQNAQYTALGTDVDAALIAQRDEARQEVADLTAKVAKYGGLTPDKVKAIKDSVAELTRERDAARTKVEDLTKKRDESAAQNARYAALIAQRDKARQKVDDLTAIVAEYTPFGTPDDIKDMMGGKSVADKLAAARAKVAEYTPFGTPGEVKAIKDRAASLKTERDAARVESVELKRQIDELNTKLAAGGVVGGVKPSVVAAKSSEIKPERIDPERMEMIRRMLGGKK
jgi:uncharacterized coiled-coil DUF342 family protein